ncbi:MAG: hypothetical protein CUN55_04095 [Phototrophicales bacterium]|nr:MAG: hypothetical protein CUN55_04095 [Phototrophicales bacterium]
MATRKTLGKYEIVERIGRGGMAEVYRGYHAALDRYVAIKLLHPFLADDPEFKDRFEKEAKNVAKLRHPNIVQVFDFEYDEQDGSYYMVMELINGPTLKDLLQEKATISQRFSIHEASRIIADTSNALAYAHKRGMIHRDIKPANIMLDEDERVVLTDFGIAKIVTGGQFTASGGMVGTPAYMAPEQGLGEAGDERSDIYSLGVMLYQMVTGELPFDADTPLAIILKHVNDEVPDPRQYVPDLPDWLVDVIYTCLAKDPDKRYQSATTLLNNIRQGVKQGTRLTPLLDTFSTNPNTDGLLSDQLEDLDETDVQPNQPAGKIIIPEQVAMRNAGAHSEAKRRTGEFLPNETTAAMPSPNSITTQERNQSNRRTQWLLVALIITILAVGFLLISQDNNPFVGIFGEPTETTAFIGVQNIGTPTTTETPSPSFTPSHTPTETPTFTNTPSPFPTETPSPSPTFTETPDATQTLSVQLTETQIAISFREQTLQVAQTATQDAITFATQTVSAASTATQDARTFATQTQRAVRTATQEAIALATASAIPATTSPIDALKACERDYVLLSPENLSIPPRLSDALNPRLVRAGTSFTITIEVENASTCDWPAADGRLELVFLEDTSKLDIDYESLSEVCTLAQPSQPVYTDVNFTKPQRPRLVVPEESYPRDSVLTLEIEMGAPSTRGCYFGAWQLQFTDYDRLPIGEPIVIAIQVFGGA